MIKAEILQIVGKNRGLFARGETIDLPRPGQSFGLVYECGTQRLRTSIVLETEQLGAHGHIAVRTANSQYILKILAMPQEFTDLAHAEY